MLISIITTVKNDPVGIFSTIKSIISQNIFNKINYIIIDASDNLKTFFIIKKMIKNKKNIVYINRKDKSIYEGINQGIKIATGEYIGILNSGDIYYSNQVLSEISDIIKKNPKSKLICGNLLFFNNHGVTRKWEMNPTSFGKFDIFKVAHPTAFIKKEVLNNLNFYTEKYFISSDFHYLLNNTDYFNNNFVYNNKFTIFMREGGVSTDYSKFPIKVYEDLVILFEHYGLFFFLFYLKKILIKIPGFFNLNKKKDYKYLLSCFSRIARL